MAEDELNRDLGSEEPGDPVHESRAFRARSRRRGLLKDG
jgi:hypothetical protein